MDESLWERCVEFHGHACPGLALGFRAAEGACGILGVPFGRTGDEDLVCVSENDACGVDCIQALLSCTVGKGNLLFRLVGKNAYTFFDRGRGRGVRVVARDLPGGMSREDSIRYVLEAPFGDLFDSMEPRFAAPEKARSFGSVACSECGERAREDLVRLDGDRKLCLDCHKGYSRSFL
ncbi:MAG: FmdE family protein [Candidatus Methanoplasma sp.]|jgi:formylmethanofuran dehydrogenase subunit E|nr:FmdE family protein [Candidatus Methanoplasma sp.]